MDTTTPFAAAPRLVDPRHVAGVEFRDADAGGREPRITIGYGPGSRFHRPEAGCGEASCPVHDTMERTWCHLNFFRYKAFVHASVPRVACPERGAGTVTAPWARPGGGVRTPVRGDGRGTGEKPAGRGHRRTGRRARHGTVAVHPPLRGRGAPVRGLHGRGGDRRRRDRPQGPPTHHRRRRPGGARRDPRGAGQGLGHGETVRDGPAAGGQARSGEAAVEDRRGVRDARMPAGHPRLLRPSVRQRDLRGAQRHHPARRNPLPRLREHGLLQHHDLPDPRQTRTQHRHRLTRFTHTKQRKAN